MKYYNPNVIVLYILNASMKTNKENPMRIHINRYYTLIASTGMSLVLFFIITGCAPPQGEIQPAQQTQQISTPTLLDDTKHFISVASLGKRIINSDSFDQFKRKISLEYRNERVFLARVDEFSIGIPYSSLNQWDLALENGMIEGLLNEGFKLAEKLDFVGPRDSDEYIATSPQDAFYMHGIDLDHLSVIMKKYKSPLLLEYQVMEFSESPQINSAIVYFRMVDLASMKILASKVVKGGDLVEKLNDVNLKEYEHTHSAIKNFIFPFNLFNQFSKTAVLNIDILNISGAYKNSPSPKTMAIENGLITGLIENSRNKSIDPFLIEKTSGFKFKYPVVYNNIVFNTNPLLYENWSELINATGCTEVIMYRYIEDEGIYIRAIDAKNNGLILFSNVIPFSDNDNKGVISNHNNVSDLIARTFKFDVLSDKRLLIVDGDKHTIEADNYNIIRSKFNEMQLAIEEGIITALVRKSSSNDFSVYEKLKTLYLKRPWMYDEKIFNLNPLYLDNWTQLRNFGVDILIVYNNLIPYEKLSIESADYKKVALSYRVIDLKTGDVISANEINNL